MQLASAASVVAQAFVPVEIAKSVGLVPPIAMLLMLSVALPEFESVATIADEVVPTIVLGYVSEGVSEPTGAAAVTPVPVRFED